MIYRRWLAILLLFIGSGAHGAPAADDGVVITGVRNWRFTDGKERRARIHLLKGKIWVGGDGLGGWNKEIDRTVPEQKKILEDVEAGRVKVKSPHVSRSVDTPSGRIRHEDHQSAGLVIGIERDWTRSDGKKVRGALFNIADDEVSLLIGEQAWKVPVASLGEDDRAYLNRVIRRAEPLAPFLVLCPAGSGLGVEVDFPWIRGERFLQTGTRISFEEATALASRHLAEKVETGDWELHGVTENNFTLDPEVAARLPDFKPENSRKGYEVVFIFSKSKIHAAKRKLAGKVSDEGYYSVYLMDDGEYLERRAR